jgi:hypothetical protein
MLLSFSRYDAPYWLSIWALIQRASMYVRRSSFSGPLRGRTAAGETQKPQFGKG